MNIKLTWKFVVAFLALTFVMHEAHEITHTTVGRIICGCWGERDFNVWKLSEGCAEQHPLSLISTFAGPMFTFAMIWLGAAMLKVGNAVEKKSLGFALIFANMPFARILTAAIGGGDEVWGINKILQSHPLSWVLGLALILLILFYPLREAFKTIANKKRLGWFALFFFAPVAVDLIVVLGLLNTALDKGVLSDDWILGSPILVTAWTASVLAVFIVTRKYIYTLGMNSQAGLASSSPTSNDGSI